MIKNNNSLNKASLQLKKTSILKLSMKKLNQNGGSTIKTTTVVASFHTLVTGTTTRSNEFDC